MCSALWGNRQLKMQIFKEDWDYLDVTRHMQASIDVRSSASKFSSMHATVLSLPTGATSVLFAIRPQRFAYHAWLPNLRAWKAR